MRDIFVVAWETEGGGGLNWHYEATHARLNWMEKVVDNAVMVLVSIPVPPAIYNAGGVAIQDYTDKWIWDKGPLQNWDVTEFESRRTITTENL